MTIRVKFHFQCTICVSFKTINIEENIGQWNVFYTASIIVNVLTTLHIALLFNCIEKMLQRTFDVLILTHSTFQVFVLVDIGFRKIKALYKTPNFQVQCIQSLHARTKSENSTFHHYEHWGRYKATKFRHNEAVSCLQQEEILHVHIKNDPHYIQLSAAMIFFVFIR